MEFHSEAHVRCMGTSHTLALFLDMERMLSDQAYSKGVWGMPWRTQAMKDVARCDKLRLGASTL